ncbi:MAG: hypothetical protein DWI24_07360 [Planctomycetota bacterium]|nr:MAG: hypothetical protein DWI24_07360 [Planctomycetota bacterium]
MNRHHFLRVILAIFTVFALPAWSACAAGATRDAHKPNIIMILCDDVGLGEVSSYGGDRFQTPNIDALATSGTRFENCYSMPICGPSRCTLLTGRYPFRTGLTGNHSANAIEPGKEIMIPTVLKKLVMPLPLRVSGDR